MTKLWNAIGIMIFWIAWPALCFKLRFTTRTRAMIVCDNKVLVVKTWLGNGKWGLPGGGIKKNENALTALVREVAEETSIMLERTNCKKVGNFEYASSGLKFIYALYRVNLKTKPYVSRQLGEITEVQWINKNKLTKHNANNDVLEALNSKLLLQ